MAVQIYANNASTTLTSSIIGSDLTIAVADGSKFPSPGASQYFLATIEVGASNEVVKIIARSGNSLTVDPAGRGQDGTVAAPWASGSLIECRNTAFTMRRWARYEDLVFSYAGTIFNPATDFFTTKSVIFAASDGRLRQDNTNFIYDTATTLLTVPNATVTTLLKVPTIDSGAASDLAFKTNSGTQQFGISHIGSAVNRLNVRGAIAASGPILESVGSDADIDLAITPKGIGIAKLTAAYGLTGIVSPTSITANQNNYNPTSAGTASVLRVTTDANRTISGFAGGVSGRVVTFINVGSFGVTFTSEDTNSTAANRFNLNSASVLLPINGAITFWYDTTSSRWRGTVAPSLSVDTIQTLTDQATIAWDTSLGGWGVVTLAANRIMGAPTNLLDGKEYVLFIIQDATGSRTITSWNAVFKWSLATVPVLSTVAGSVDMFSFKSRSGNLYGGFLKGMA